MLAGQTFLLEIKKFFYFVGFTLTINNHIQFLIMILFHLSKVEVWPFRAIIITEIL